MRATVFGSAHLDILSTATSHGETLDRPGDLRIEFGGTGHNIAVNLAKLGNDVTFVTAMSESLISSSIVDAMYRAGVRSVMVDHHPDLPEAGFSAHSVDGDLVSAVSSMPVDRVRIDPSLVSRTLQGADCVIADCNLSRETLADIGAAARNAGVPLFLAGTSESKALKTLSFTSYPGVVSGLFLNGREMAYLLRAQAAGFRDPRGDNALGPALLAADLGATIVETRGAGGVRVWVPHEGRSIEFGPRSVGAVLSGGAPERRRRRDDDEEFWLGAGDHLLARTLDMHVRRGILLSLAAVSASRHVSANHGRRACHLGTENPLEARMRSLVEAAHVDRLTGLLNRAGLDHMLAGLPGGRRAGILLIDIDHFKAVNDTRGHDVGDAVLRRVAEVMGRCVRESDCLARWGGEEMIAVLPDTEPDAAAEVAERVRREVEACDMVGFHVTVSIGTASGPVGDISRAWFDDLRDQADRALYRAKRGGRNRVVRADQASSEATSNLRTSGGMARNRERQKFLEGVA